MIITGVQKKFFSSLVKLQKKEILKINDAWWFLKQVNLRRKVIILEKNGDIMIITTYFNFFCDKTVKYN